MGAVHGKVWAWPNVRSTAAGPPPAPLPLYPKLPLAAAQDPALYELPASFDPLRIGQAREREMARKLLTLRGAENRIFKRHRTPQERA